MPTISCEAQPLGAAVTRVVAALEYLGQPLDAATTAMIEAAIANPCEEAATAAIQNALDPHCLAMINVSSESLVSVQPGPVKPQLVESGWTVFLVKVHNEAGVSAQLRAKSPNAASTFDSPKDELRERWLELALFQTQPMAKSLSGLVVEYRIVQLYSRDAGTREAKLLFDVGQGTQAVGFCNEIDVVFQCVPAQDIMLRIIDENDEPCAAGFEIRDEFGRVYPAQSKRAAPDFGFHPQVYRGDGDTLRLPPGRYAVKFMRGPEMIPELRTVDVTPEVTELSFKVQRWIDPSLYGWFSGDHHIHAAGCAHYTKPSEGVHAPDMMLHCLGEDLKVGCNLTWGPCFDYQKQFFTGEDDKVSSYPYLLRYDIEISGFGSHQSGHLCLLRLKEQIYPGGDSMDHWPTLCLNSLRWAKGQGAVCGPAHSGWGLAVETKELPNYIVPPFDGIGANEYIVDVTHVVKGPDGDMIPAVDFLATVDTPYVWELNIWYHTLNAGFRTRISGETDFPCIYGERVGLGRSYCKLDGALTFEAWCQSIAEGRNYASDGYSHLLDFTVDDVRMGENGSELQIPAGGKTVIVNVSACAMLGEEADEIIANTPYEEKPYWHIERARVKGTRKVPLEILVNGYPAIKTEIVADGTIQHCEFELDIPRSSWVAARILPSSHTNPIFVIVGGKPIRAFRRSLEWCLQSVDQCWKNKERFISESELEGAKKDYAHARQVYRERLAECEVDGPETTGSL